MTMSGIVAAESSGLPWQLGVEVGSGILASAEMPGVSLKMAGCPVW